MRITILVNHDLPALLALNYLIPALKQHDVSVFFSLKKFSFELTKSLTELAEFDARSLDRPSRLLSFEAFGAKLLNHVNTVDYDQFAATKPDLAVSIRYMTILKSDAISVPRCGVINLHSGLLPSYQGVMATFWAMLNKELKLGTTLHFIEDSQIDTGSIILGSETEANYRRSYLWNVLNIYRAGCANILQVIAQMSLGQSISSTPQSGRAYYYSFPNAEQINSAGIPLYNQTDNVDPFL